MSSVELHVGASRRLVAGPGKRTQNMPKAGRKGCLAFRIISTIIGRVVGEIVGDELGFRRHKMSIAVVETGLTLLPDSFIPVRRLMTPFGCESTSVYISARAFGISHIGHEKRFDLVGERKPLDEHVVAALLASGFVASERSATKCVGMKDKGAHFRDCLP